MRCFVLLLPPLPRLYEVLPKSQEEREQRLREQAMNNEFHRFVDKHLILHQAYLDKRKVCLRIVYIIFLVVSANFVNTHTTVTALVSGVLVKSDTDASSN